MQPMQPEIDHADDEQVRDATADPQVEAALEPLAELDVLAVHEHAGVIEGVHRALQDRLAEGQE